MNRVYIVTLLHEGLTGPQRISVPYATLRDALWAIDFDRKWAVALGLDAPRFSLRSVTEKLPALAR